jgi:DnaJ homolog subfamily A member 2
MFNFGGNKQFKCDNKLYDLLNVDKNASSEDIKKAYKKMALKHHPDRNRDNTQQAEQQFKEISKAYSILRCPEKRATYDKFGMDYLEETGGVSQASGFDIFENLFGGNGMGMNMGMNMGKTKGKSRHKELNVTLNDLYSCKKINLSLKRVILCTSCKGSGALSPQHISNCTSCDGSGVTIQIQQLGPGFMSQSRTICVACNGNGKKILQKCTDCNGKKTINIKSSIKLQLTQNMKDGEQIVYEGFADHIPDVDIQGDLVIQLNQIQHPRFTRKNNNLLFKLDILLSQALCGGKINFTHLDGRQLYIELTDIISPNMCKVIKHEGMYQSGDLIIEFNIIMPECLSSDHKNYLSKLLPTASINNLDNHIRLDYNDYDSKIHEDNSDTFNEQQHNSYPNQQEQVQCAQQ